MSARTETLAYTGAAGRIDCAVDWPDGTPRGWALVLHPHPLQGGARENKVVTTIARACVQHGLVAVRPISVASACRKANSTSPWARPATCWPWWRRCASSIPSWRRRPGCWPVFLRHRRRRADLCGAGRAGRCAAALGADADGSGGEPVPVARGAGAGRHADGAWRAGRGRALVRGHGLGAAALDSGGRDPGRLAFLPWQLLVLRELVQARLTVALG